MRKITHLQMVALYTVHKELENKVLPFKFTIAQNLKTLDKVYNEYKTEQEKLHLQHVVIDETGSPTVKDAVKKAIEESKGAIQSIPYTAFEYKSENDEKEFFKALKELNEKEIEVEIIQESLERDVRVKVDAETIKVKLKEYLDEFCEVLSIKQIGSLLEHEILV